MSGVENAPAQKPEDRETIDPGVDLRGIRDALVRLDADDTLWRRRGEDYRERAEAELRRAKQRLKSLYSTHGQSNDFQDLVAMYEDIEKDFKAERELSLDESLVQKAEAAHQAMESAGVRACSISELAKGDLSNLATKLQTMGLSVDYVVPSRKEGAPTIILMPQLHPNPGMSIGLLEAAGIMANQDSIHEAIKRMQAAGLANVVFSEGIPLGRSASEKDAALNPTSGVSRAKIELGQGIQIRGIEDPEFFRKALVEIDDPVTIMLRMTANNLFLAENLISSIGAGKVSVSTVVIGAAHETNLSDSSGKKHPFPLSQILAHYGASVIVVNRPHLDSGRLKSYLESNPNELSKLGREMGQMGAEL